MLQLHGSSPEMVPMPMPQPHGSSLVTTPTLMLRPHGLLRRGTVLMPMLQLLGLLPNVQRPMLMQQPHGL